MKLTFSRKNFEEKPKYQISPESVQWERVVPCGQTVGWTDTTKLTDVFRNFANAPKKAYKLITSCALAIAVTFTLSDLRKRTDYPPPYPPSRPRQIFDKLK